MGSRSKSSTSSTQNTTDITTSLADNRVVGDGGFIDGNVTLGKSTGNITINKSDFGAIQKAGDISSASLTAAEDIAEGAFELGDSAIAANADLAYESIRFAGGTFDSAIGAVLDNDELNNQLVLQALDYNQALIRHDKQGDTANITDQVLEKIVPVTLVIGGVLVALRFAKR